MCLALFSASEIEFLPNDDLSLDLAAADVQLLGGSLPCTICDKVLGFAIGKIAKHGCGFLLKVEMAAVCEAAGLGPEDPLADICVVTLVGACGKIASMIAQHIEDPATVCAKLHLCS